MVDSKVAAGEWAVYVRTGTLGYLGLPLRRSFLTAGVNGLSHLAQHDVVVLHLGGFRA